jgi:hypothetical protein
MKRPNDGGDSHDANAPFDPIDELFGGANPNPDRIGCPPRGRLEELARRRGAIDDPFYVHIGQCSECYREWRALQREAASKTGADRSSQRIAARASSVASSVTMRRALLVAAAVVIVVLAVWAWQQQNRQPRNEVVNRDQHAAGTLAKLDLRPFRIERRDAPAERSAPLLLHPGVLTVTILLPVGSEPGPYDIKIIDRDLVAHASTSAEAAIRDYVTQLPAVLDLRSVPPGPCQLALRHAGDDWRLYPAELANR